MKIYFNASGRGYKQYGETYRLIYKCLQDLGHTLLDDSIIKFKADIFYEGTDVDRLNKDKNALRYIKEADLVVIEVSVNSFSMGYILHLALDLGKPVIAIYRDDNQPLFASLIENDKLQVLDYTNKNLKSLLHEAISCASGMTGTRFNFYLSPLLSHYLDQIAHLWKIPRAVYLRQLIEQDYEKNKATFATA